jgi:hypothetical protein
MLDRFLELQKTGEYTYRKQGYQQLHKQMDVANAMVDRLGYGQLSKMPLKWRDQHTTYRKDRGIGSLPFVPSSQLSKPIGQAAGSSG